MKYVTVVSLLVFSLAIPSLGVERSFRVTLRIVDGTGDPVQGARAGVTYENMSVIKGAGHFVSREGSSGDDGRTIFDGSMFLNRLAYGASKEGYYITTNLKYYFSDESNDRWLPWNPTVDVILKKINNPVPMYAKRVSTSLPGDGAPEGFDLEIGDWVEPYGKGRTSDLIFVSKVDRRGELDYDWVLKVSFSNPGDGLQRFKPGSETGGSGLRSPYEAPADGYLPEWTLTRSRRPESREKSTFDRHGGYFFRVRSELDGQGHVVKAWYGKIYGDFFDLVYYLNPDGTRNVEFDPKRNLFKPTNPWDSAFVGLSP